MPQKSSYCQILKSSSIMVGAAGINLLLGMIRTKFVAVSVAEYERLKGLEQSTLEHGYIQMAAEQDMNSIERAILLHFGNR